MNGTGRWKAIVVAAAALGMAMLGTGCGSNPPCETDLAAVDAARKAAADAEARLEDLKKQKQELEQQLAQEKSRSDELARKKAELEAKIAELSK
ncbi:MAG: hypothetical protein U0167_05845 [bacterium]